MKKILILLIGFSFAESVGTDEQQILNIMNNYKDAFIIADYKSIIEYFTLPISFNFNQKTIHVNSKFKLKHFYKTIRGSLPEFYAYSRWENMSVRVLSERIAVVNTIYSRYDRNNRIFNSGSALYFLRKIDKEWKFFSLTSYEFSNYFNLETQ